MRLEHYIYVLITVNKEYRLAEVLKRLREPMSPAIYLFSIELKCHFEKTCFDSTMVIKEKS